MAAPNTVTEGLSMRTGELPALKLVVVEGPDAGASLLLGAGTFRIGKGDETELKLSDSSVSRLHLVVKVLHGAVRFTDPGSRNGSFLSGHRFTEVDAGPYATVKIGRTQLQLQPVSDEGDALAPSKRDTFGALWGQSLPMRRLFTALERLAAASADVCVFGESGTGKELTAEALHRHSARASGPFVVCDLAAVAPSLFESELFGHVRGAFTGASTSRSGAFESAHGGTLFLDEVGELPIELQPRLLRLLERREVKAVGSDAWRKVDVRVVTATHRDLKKLVAEGRFREDLFHRLTVLTVTLPPVRERAGDLPGLIDRLLAQQGKKPEALSAKARAAMLSHDWPGNVRELKNVLTQTLHLGEARLGVAGGKKKGQAAGPFRAAKERLIETFEVDYLKELLERTGGNVSQAARESGLDRVHLHRLMRKHGLSGRASAESEPRK